MVSVIVPAYNQEKFLAYALQSVSAQTCPEWECLIINDGSTDGTSAVAKDFVIRDARFRLINQENAGLAGARNSGLAAATGDYVVFLDSDDALLPEMLAELTMWLDARPGVPGVVCSCRLIDTLGNAFESRQKVAARSRWSAVLWSLFMECPVPVFSLANLFSPVCGCWRRDVFDEVGCFDRTATGLEDYDMWLRILLARGAWGRVEAELTEYRCSPGSMSRNIELMSNGWSVAQAKFFKALDKDGVPALALRAWETICRGVREQVFPHLQMDSAVTGTEMELALHLCGLPRDEESIMRQALIVHLVLLGAPNEMLKALRAGRQDLALAGVIGGIRAIKNRQFAQSALRVAGSVMRSPIFILGPVALSCIRRSYFPLTRTFLRAA